MRLLRASTLATVTMILALALMAVPALASSGAAASNAAEAGSSTAAETGSSTAAETGLSTAVETGPADAQRQRRAVQARMDDIEGAWELVEAWGRGAAGEWQLQNPQPSVYLFAHGYYSIMYVDAERARPDVPADTPRQQISEELLRGIFEPFNANSGTYRLEGSTLTTNPIVALVPNFVGGGHVYTVRREGSDSLVLTRTGEDFQGNYRLRRLR